MKKWIAAFLGILLVLTASVPALAEEQEAVLELNWEVYASTIEESGIEATYVLLDETGVMVWIPDVFLLTYVPDEEEATEEEAQEEEEADADENEDDKDNVLDVILDEELIAAFGPEDQSALIEITIPEVEEGEDVTWEALVNKMLVNDEDDPEEYLIGHVLVNGMDGVYLQIKDGTIGILLVEYEPQKYLKFTFWPIDDPEMMDVFDIISTSIQKVEVEGEVEE